MMPSTSSSTLLTRSIPDSSLVHLARAASLALAVALTAAAAQFTIPLPFTAVPFVLTPLVVLLAGAALGSRLGFAAQALYLAAGAAGLDVFAPSATLPPGAARLAGPTGGYLWAYPLAAFVTGSLAERGWDRRYWTSLAAMLLGMSVIFLGGVAWLALAFTGSLPAAIASGLAPFVLADIVKAAVAAAILPAAWRLIGQTPGRQPAAPG
jgi:biotin transport system substrate-specific component